MNEMYSMSIVAHNYGVMAVLGAVFINMIVLILSSALVRYRRFSSLFTPIASTMIGFVIFTGVVMMAAKHLQFTVLNVVMIAMATLFLFFEVKRLSPLKYLHTDEEFEIYKKGALRVLAYEVVGVLVVAFLMWI